MAQCWGLSAAGFAGAAATAAIATKAFRTLSGVVSEQLNKLDAVAKVSARLGFATDEFIGLRLAAEQLSGVGASTFAQAMQRMTRRIAEVAIGTGEAKKAMDELGLDAVALNAAGPAEAFKLLADAFQNVSNEGDRLRLGFKLFDSEGAALVTTLTAGREAIEAVEARAKELRITLSGVDAAQVERAVDAVGELKLAFEGMAVVLTNPGGTSPCYPGSRSH